MKKLVYLILLLLCFLIFSARDSVATVPHDIEDYNPSTLTNAVNQIGSAETTLIIDVATSISDDTEVPPTLTLVFYGPGKVDLNGYDLTINGPLHAPISKIFDIADSGSQVIMEGAYIDECHPEWFGAIGDGTTDDGDEIKACAQSGLKITKLLNRFYNIGSTTIEVPNYVTIAGSASAINPGAETDFTKIKYTGGGTESQGDNPYPYQAFRTKEGYDDTGNSFRCGFKDLYIELTGQRATGIQLDVCRSCFVENVTVFLNGGANSNQTGIRMRSEVNETDQRETEEDPPCSVCYKGNFSNTLTNIRIIGDSKDNGHIGINMSGASIEGDGQNNNNSIYTAYLSGLDKGLVLGSSLSIAFYNMAFETIKTTMIEVDGEGNTFFVPYFEKLGPNEDGTGVNVYTIDFKSGSQGIIIYNPLFHGNAPITMVRDSGTNNRIYEQIKTWVKAHANSVISGNVLDDLESKPETRSRLNADGSLYMGDGIENLTATTTNNVSYIEPRTSLFPTPAMANPTGSHKADLHDTVYLVDNAGRNFYILGVRIGMTVENTTDGCQGIVTSISTTSSTNDTLNFAGGLSGCTSEADTDWDGNEVFVVYNTKNHPAIHVGNTGTFSTPEDIVTAETAIKQTTTASTVNLWNRTLVEGDAYLIEAYVVAKQGDTNRASYIRRALVYRTIGGNATIQGTVDNVFTRESDTNWDCTMDVNGGNIRVRITGTGNTIDWKAGVRVTPVMD
jgi:hypothetical protein